MRDAFDKSSGEEKATGMLYALLLFALVHSE